MSQFDEWIGRPAARAARMGVVGAASVPDLAYMPINAGLSVMGRDPYMLPSEMASNGFDYLTNNYAAPRDKNEEMVNALGQLLAAGGALGGLSRMKNGAGLLDQMGHNDGSKLGMLDFQDTQQAGPSAQQISMPIAPSSPKDIDPATLAELAKNLRWANNTQAKDVSTLAMIKPREPKPEQMSWRKFISKR